MTNSNLTRVLANKKWQVSVCLLFLFTLLSCEKEDKVMEEELTGSWRVEAAYYNPAMDLLKFLDTNNVLTLNTDKSFDISKDLIIQEGKWRIDKNIDDESRLKLDFETSSLKVDAVVKHDGAKLTLMNYKLVPDPNSAFKDIEVTLFNITLVKIK